MDTIITYLGYNNGYNNPVYNAHKNVDAYYTWEHIIHCKIWYVH